MLIFPRPILDLPNGNIIFIGDGMNAIRVKNGSIADGRKITVQIVFCYLF